MIRHQRLGFALAALLVVQPASALLCSMACVSVAERPSEQLANDAAPSDCHEQAAVQNVGGLTLWVGAPAHGCDHSFASSSVLAVEKVHASGFLFDARVSVALHRPAEHGAVLSQNSHAPPGRLTPSTDVLRV